MTYSSNCRPSSEKSDMRVGAQGEKNELEKGRFSLLIRLRVARLFAGPLLDCSGYRIKDGAGYTWLGQARRWECRAPDQRLASSSYHDTPCRPCPTSFPQTWPFQPSASLLTLIDPLFSSTCTITAHIVPRARVAGTQITIKTDFQSRLAISA